MLRYALVLDSRNKDTAKRHSYENSVTHKLKPINLESVFFIKPLSLYKHFLLQIDSNKLLSSMFIDQAYITGKLKRPALNTQILQLYIIITAKNNQVG